MHHSSSLTTSYISLVWHSFQTHPDGHFFLYCPTHIDFTLTLLRSSARYPLDIDVRLSFLTHTVILTSIQIVQGERLLTSWAWLRTLEEGDTAGIGLVPGVFDAVGAAVHRFTFNLFGFRSFCCVYESELSVTRHIANLVLVLIQRSKSNNTICASEIRLL